MSETKEQRFAYFEMGLRIQIAKAKGELPGEELNPEWAEWAETLLAAEAKAAALRSALEDISKGFACSCHIHAAKYALEANP